MKEPGLSDVAEPPKAAAQAWNVALGGVLNVEAMLRALGLDSVAEVEARLERRELIGIQAQSGRWNLPAFQIRDGVVDDVLVVAFWAVAESIEPWTAASWCVSPNDDLGGASPSAWRSAGREAGRLLQVAERDAARLAG